MKIQTIIPIIIVITIFSTASAQVVSPANVIAPIHDTDMRSITQKTIVITNSIGQCYHNSMFATGQLIRDTTVAEFDLSLFYKYHLFSKAPLKIKDCVFFNPYENFIANYSAEQSDGLGDWKLNNTLSVWEKQHKLLLGLPYSLRFYIDTAEITLKPEQIEMNLDTNFKFPYEKYLKPFYFRKYEVTNAEYREFTNWVRDSIAHVLLGDVDDPDNLGQHYILPKNYDPLGEPPESSIIDWNAKIDWENEEVRLILEDPNYGLFIPEHERFYMRKQIDPRKLNYVYYKENDGKIVRTIINIYPDTLRWTHDFNYSFNQPMSQNYFWHPAYNDYPVVGVNYYQAIAFLHWKTLKHQKELDAKGIKLKVEYDLPNEAEWDIAATADFCEKEISIYTNNYYYLADENWITDLSLKQDRFGRRTDSINEETNTYYVTLTQDNLFEQLQKNSIFRGNLGIEGAIYTQKCFIEKSDKNELLNSNKDELGICFMGGNVSEWLKESYSENWNPIFTKRQQLLKTFKGEDCKILSELEMYYDKRNDKNGKLVRGSNWWDERFSSKLGKNVEGMNAKLFVSPDSAHCTLGFRYVIHISPKE